MSERPIWCNNPNCEPLVSQVCLSGIQCIGKLKEAREHLGQENPMAWCHGGPEDKFYVNQYDFIVFIYIMGRAMEAQDYKIPASIVNGLPKDKEVKV